MTAAQVEMTRAVPMLLETAPSFAPKLPSLAEDTIFPPTPPPEAEDTSLEALSSTPLAPLTPIRPDDTPLVAVIGVGYVGTHLVEVFSAQYQTLGFDVSEKRLGQLRDDFLGNPRVDFTSQAANLAGATHFLISVPTLLLPDKSIDSSYLRSALRTVAQHARPGATIVVESSVAVGMTRELVGPLALAKGCFAGMSPERVDPGRVEPAASQIPKIVSGLDDLIPGSLSSILRLYGKAFDRVVPVSKPEVAEMTKLYENCQRMMCIAYANEMANSCVPHGIDPYEVCDAAATKPFGYTPYSPGVGVGGHCIPVNPYYLLSNSSFPLLKAATESMWQRPAALADRCLGMLRTPDTCPGEGAVAEEEAPKVLVVGVGFKPGQSTLSNSPGLDVLKRLSSGNRARVTFADTMVTQDMVPGVPRLADEDWTTEVLESFDMVIVTMRQVGMDFGVLAKTRGVKVQFLCR